MIFKFDNGDGSKIYLFNNIRFLLERIETEEIGVNGEIIEIPVTLKKINIDSEKNIAFNEREIFEVKNWLFKKEYRYLEVRSILYSSLFKRDNITWLDNASRGIIKLTLCIRNIAKGIPYTIGRTLDREISIEIKKVSNLGEYGYPEVEIDVFRETSRITIENLDIPNSKMTLSALTGVKNIRIHTEKKFIESTGGTVMPSGSYLKLKNGINRIKVTCNGGLIKFNLSSQNKFRIESEYLNG